MRVNPGSVTLVQNEANPLVPLVTTDAGYCSPSVEGERIAWIFESSFHTPVALLKISTLDVNGCQFEIESRFLFPDREIKGRLLQ